MLFFLYILIAVVILLVMVLIHEFGHYAAAKALGFRINEFSVGFGPTLLQRRRKCGELFSLRAVPLGGYCAFYSEEDEEPDASDARADVAATSDAGAGCATTAIARAGCATDPAPVPFEKQKPWKRIIVMLAGATFNMLSAFVFAFIYLLVVGYTVPEVTTLYTDPDTGRPYASELEKGDVIVAVDGTPLSVMDSFASLTADVRTGESVTVTVIRDGRRVDATITRRHVVITTDEGVTEGEMFGISNANVRAEMSVLEAAGWSFPFTFKLSWAIVSSLGQLVTGNVPVADMAGPVGTVATIATYAELDLRYLLLFLPLIASNLAIFNILPIPGLDGAKVVFTAIEWVRGKPINKKVEGAIHSVGLLLLIGAVLVIDVIGFIARA